MKKMFLMNGMAALAVGVLLTACSGDDLFTQADAVRNAKDLLGVTIDANRDWNMTTQVKAEVAVQGDYGVNYEVVVYENNPFIDNKGTVLGRSTALSGSTASFEFTAPKGTSAVFVCLRDAKGYNYLKPVAIIDGKLQTAFGGADVASSPGFYDTRSQATRGTEADDFVIPTAEVPFTTDDITAYLANAKEPNDENIVDNNDGSYWVDGTEGHWVIDTPASIVWPKYGQYQWGGAANNVLYYPPGATDEDKAWFEANCRELVNYSVNWNDFDSVDGYVALVLAVRDRCQSTGRTDWITLSGTWERGYKTEEVKHWEDATEGYMQKDETYVLDFKITGSWNKNISVLSSEDVPIWENNSIVGYTRAHRDVYITGTWTLPTGEQRVGGGANIVVCRGGTLNIPEGAEMNFVNQARLVVMPGGTVTGAGKINITNGTAEDGYGYNGGTISVGTFTNNFGTFFNYGNLFIQNMEGASKYSLYVNHGKTLVQSATKGSNTANMRVYNNCWFECTSGFACRNIVQGEGAYFKAANLEMSGSEDGTTDHAFIYAKANSLIKVPGAVALNNVDIIGPTTDGDYAYLQFGYVEGENGSHGLSTATNYTTTWESGVEYMSAGAIQNNVRISVDHPEVDSSPSTFTPYEKILNMLNGTLAFYVAEINPTLDQYNQKNEFPVQGNGNATLVRSGQYTGVATEASDCSPAIEIEEAEEIIESNKIWSYAFEDSYNADYDMNDVVLKVKQNDTYPGKLDVTLCCTGASYNLKVNLTKADGTVVNLFGATEVHSVLGGSAGTFINTVLGETHYDEYTTQIDKPADFQFGTADFWIESPEGNIHVATEGQDPHGIIIPGDWQWPTERTRITEAYPSFANYYIDGGVDDRYVDWYKYPAEANIYVAE